MKPTLHIFRGLPGSGKTTAAKELGLDHHFEADQWFDLYNKGQFDPDKLPIAHLWCFSHVSATLCDGLDVSVANTFVQSWELERYLMSARITEANVRLTVCSYPGKSVHNVPEETIAHMKTRWENFRITDNYQLEIIKKPIV